MKHSYSLNYSPMKPTHIPDLKQKANLQIIMPFLQKNEFSRYLDTYTELKDVGLERCKKSLVSGISKIIEAQKQKNQKNLIHPCQQRAKYQQLSKWLQSRLQFLQDKQIYKNFSTLEYIQQQKKIIISCKIQLLELFRSQCQQKSSIISMLLDSSIQIINTVLIQLQSNCSSLILSHLKSKNQGQKQLLNKLNTLLKENQELKLQKNHKWKNLFMIVKDNRIIRKQKKKLFRLLKQEQWKVKTINQQHLKLKEENQKFTLLLDNPGNNSEQGQKILKYIATKLQVDQIDKFIKLYPKKAHKIVINQLKKIQIHQISTLQQKLSHILKALQNAGEIIDDFDQIGDFLDTNKVKMYFNISTQTQVQYCETSMNTIQKHFHNTQTQVPLSRLHLRFQIERLTLSEKIKPFEIYQKRVQRKGKTVNLQNSQKVGLNKSNRKIGSIKKLLLQSGDLAQGFQYVNEVNIRYPNDFQTTKSFQNFKRTESFSSDSDDQSSQKQNQRQRVRIKDQSEYKVRFQNFQPLRRNRDTVDSNEAGLKFPNRNKQKRMSRVQNMHTFSSKSKIRQLRGCQQNWKITKLYGFGVNEQHPKMCQNIMSFTFQNNRNLNRQKNKVPSFNTQNYLTGNLLTNKSNKRLNYQNDQNQIEDEEEEFLQIQKKLATNRNISQCIDPEDAVKIVVNYEKGKQQEQNDNQSYQQFTPYLTKSSKFKKGKLKKPAHRKSQSQQSVDTLNAKRQSKQSINTINTISTNAIANLNYFQNRLFTQQSNSKAEYSNLNTIKNKISQKRLSQFPSPMINLNSLKAKKHNRQASFISGPLENNINQAHKMIKKRTSQFTMHSFGNQKYNTLKHNRTKTQQIQQIQQIAEETFMTTLKNFPQRNLQKSSASSKNIALQKQFLETFSPKKKFNISNLSDLEKIQSNCQQQQTQSVNFDLMKNVDKLIKNISQRSTEIIKKQYLFKDFLISFYQQQYGGSGNLKLCLQFIEELKKRRNSNYSIINCLSLLMNENCPAIYLKDIFKLFTVMIDKNGGSLNNNAGGHQFYKKVFSEMLSIFIQQIQVKIITQALCIQSLNGTLVDYFIAGEMEIRSRSLKTSLYKFLSEQILLASETLVSFQLIKQITFFISVNSLKFKNKIMQLRVYSEPNIQLHRLCLISKKMIFPQLSEIQYTIEKRYQQFEEMCKGQFQQKKIMDLMAKQAFTNFPYLKQSLHRQIQNHYKYNIPISRTLLKLCHLTAFQQKMQNEFPLAQNIRILNQQNQKLQRLKYYKEIIGKSS